MKILDLKPVADRGGGSMRLLALFDLELDDRLRLFGLRLMEAMGGKRIVYAPNANGGRRMATFSSSLAEQITAAAILEFERQDTADDRSHTAPAA